CSWIARPPSSPPFPYTTLFRSPHRAALVADRERHAPGEHLVQHAPERIDVAGRAGLPAGEQLGREVLGRAADGAGPRDGLVALRSEEHTSELQSRENLVCRLLL